MPVCPPNSDCLGPPRAGRVPPAGLAPLSQNKEPPPQRPWFELSERCARFSRVFGFSFGELLLICMVALVAVGPKKLPGMLHTLGQWLRKIRNMTSEVRSQSGIDELLRAEGLHGGLNELRGLLRGVQHEVLEPPRPVVNPTQAPVPAPIEDPYANLDIDVSREYPLEGADSYGALPDDLLDNDPVKSESPAATSSEPVKSESPAPSEPVKSETPAGTPSV